MNEVLDSNLMLLYAMTEGTMWGICGAKRSENKIRTSRNKADLR